MTYPVQRSIITSLIVVASIAAATAGEHPPQERPPILPTSLGVRFTPDMARALGQAFSKQMRSRYDLSNEQSSAVADIIARRTADFASKHQDAVRDLIEFTIAAMIANDGELTRDSAMQFAKRAQALVPGLKQLTIDASSDIKQQLSAKQRLKLTGDLAAFSAGIIAFDARMVRWKEGKVPDNPDPFWDQPVTSAPSTQPAAAPQFQATLQAARQIGQEGAQLMLGQPSDWQEYLENSAAYYGFTEPQQVAARSILAECMARARPLHSPERVSELAEIQTLVVLTTALTDPVANNSPWLSDLSDRATAITQPMRNLDAEFKLRIRELAFAEQIAAAEKIVYEKLEKKGYKKPAAP